LELEKIYREIAAAKAKKTAKTPAKSQEAD
jgi:hypothetical protein